MVRLNDIQKEKVVMSKDCLRTKRIDNWIPYLEVVPKKIKRDNGLFVAQMTEPYAGEIGLVVSTGSTVDGKLVLYDKHLKKKVKIDTEDRWFIAEENVLCEIEILDGMEIVDYVSADFGESFRAEEPRFEDRRLKNYIEV